jgi:hypothetical protein
LLSFDARELGIDLKSLYLDREGPICDGRAIPLYPIRLAAGRMIHLPLPPTDDPDQSAGMRPGSGLSLSAPTSGSNLV